MPGVRRGLVTLVLAVALLAGGPLTGASSGAAATQADEPIRLDQAFSLTPEEPGSVSVELRYSIPNDIISLGTTVPGNATVTDAAGFERENASHYTWDGATERPTLTYRLSVNRTANRFGPKAANGSYLAVDTGEWALFTRPDAPTDFEYTRDYQPSFERSASVEGEGAAGEWLVYLGPQDTFTSTAHGQTFQLVVPAAASMSESPREVLDMLERTSDRLRVGDRDEEVFVVAAPTEGVPWAVRGFQTGDADMWVRDSEGLSAPANVWVHEYVHTRQAFETADNASWLVEGMSSYYATLYTFEHQALTFDGFADRLARGNGTSRDDVTLSSPSTWQGVADYYKGALVTGQLDRRLRLGSDGERTMQTVFAGLNTRDRVNGSVFVDEVERAGDGRTRRLAANYTRAATNVSMWNRSAHRTAFGPLPARIAYDLPGLDDDDGYRISGPFRNVSAAPQSPIELVTGETIAIDVLAHNDGGTTGSYVATLRLNGTRVDSASGQVAPNGTAVATLEHTFVLPGRYVASVDGESVPLRVRRPGVATVTNLSVEPTEVRRGESAVATVVVQNEADGPAERELVLTRDFREVDRETVRVGANEIERVEFEVDFPQAGAARVGVNSQASVTVSVAPTPQGTDTPTATSTANGTASASTPTSTDTSGAGFGIAVTVAAVALVALGGRRWK